MSSSQRRSALHPPLPQLPGDLITDWEGFVNEAPALPSLIRSGLIHDQFETIHSFL